jgi:hypothetical protein
MQATELDDRKAGVACRSRYWVGCGGSDAKDVFWKSYGWHWQPCSSCQSISLDFGLHARTPDVALADRCVVGGRQPTADAVFQRSMYRCPDVACIASCTHARRMSWRADTEAVVTISASVLSSATKNCKQTGRCNSGLFCCVCLLFATFCQNFSNVLSGVLHLGLCFDHC